MKKQNIVKLKYKYKLVDNKFLSEKNNLINKKNFKWLLKQDNHSNNY